MKNKTQTSAKRRLLLQTTWLTPAILSLNLPAHATSTVAKGLPNIIYSGAVENPMMASLHIPSSTSTLAEKMMQVIIPSAHAGATPQVDALYLGDVCIKSSDNGSRFDAQLLIINRQTGINDYNYYFEAKGGTIDGAAMAMSLIDKSCTNKTYELNIAVSNISESFVSIMLSGDINSSLTTIPVGEDYPTLADLPEVCGVGFDTF